ncbi:ABC transporter substrate-binding protein [Clostridium sp.]|uniref:ABC transporter substrate-binding protein n=1 Tax=Clostridium sp. TaxID=1506 RepID=UPI0034640A9E
MKGFKKVIGLLTILILTFAMMACSSTPEEKKSTDKQGVTYPLTIKDSYNREVTLDKEPERIVSIAPSITEIVAALGKEDKLVGRTDFCTYPESIKKVESIGGLQDPNIEKIVELKPDVVIASTHFKEDVLKKLEELNIKVIVLYGEESFDGAYDTIEKVSTVLNAKDKGTEIVDGMKNKVEDVKKRVEGKDKKKTYYVVGYGKGGDFTAGGDTFIGEIIEMAGGENAAKDLKGWKYSLEKVVESNPDLMVVAEGMNNKEGLKEANGYKDLKAVKEDKIYEIDQNILNLQGPRLADGLYELAKIIHPEAFK